MGIEEIYSDYVVTHEICKKFRGWPGAPTKIYRAIKDCAKFYVFPDLGEHLPHTDYKEIMRIQNAIPHMARFLEPRQNHVLMEDGGDLIWHFNEIANIDIIEKQLYEFVAKTTELGLLHNDLRPWNICMDNQQQQIKVIDWSNSVFATQGGHDFEDIKRIMRLLKGDPTPLNDWQISPLWRPDWLHIKT